MEVQRTGISGGRRLQSMVALAVVHCIMAAMLPEVSATRWTVGGNMGWTSNVNYTIWAQDKHFYNGDWFFFVYDRNQMNVLEVNKTDYESCNSDHPLHNWTTGAGRDVVPLNVTRHYYFISGRGFCYGGMKLAVSVENPPPPPFASHVKDSPMRSVENPSPSPSPSPVKDSAMRSVENPSPPPSASPGKGSAMRLTSGCHVVLPLVFATGAIWDAFVRY